MGILQLQLSGNFAIECRVLHIYQNPVHSFRVKLNTIIHFNGSYLARRAISRFSIPRPSKALRPLRSTVVTRPITFSGGIRPSGSYVLSPFIM
jgi:hypothetical protein